MVIQSSFVRIPVQYVRQWLNWIPAGRISRFMRNAIFSTSIFNFNWCQKQLYLHVIGKGRFVSEWRSSDTSWCVGKIRPMLFLGSAIIGSPIDWMFSSSRAAVFLRSGVSLLPLFKYVFYSASSIPNRQTDKKHEARKRFRSSICMQKIELSDKALGGSIRL